MNREEIIERIEGCMDEMFRDFQSENDIESGDAPFDIVHEMNKAEEAFVDTIEQCMWWQKLNARKDYEVVCSFMTRNGKVEILQWGQNDYSAEFLDADYSVRGSLEDIMREIEF